MKNIFKILCIMTVTFFFVTSCDKLDDEVMASNNTSSKIVEPQSGSSYVITIPTKNNVFMKLQWKAADFGANIPVQYVFQITQATDTKWENAKEITLTTELVNQFTGEYQYEILGVDLNNALVNAGGSINVSGDYMARIKAFPLGENTALSNSLVNYSSNVLTFKATPYDSFDEFPKIYVPGGYQAASGYAPIWEPSKAPALFSPKSDGVYSGFVYMDNSSPLFKFTAKGDWSDNKGDITAPPNNSYTTLKAPGENIKGDEGPGVYYFPEVNYGANTYKMEYAGDMMIAGDFGDPIVLNFIVDSSSPYYRKYTATDVEIKPGIFYFTTSNNEMLILGSANTDTSVSDITVSTKLKIAGGKMKTTQTGKYRVVLDIKNSANYNFKFVAQ